VGDRAFAGRSVLVTGGCRGVGRGIATRFLAAGADVAVCCRHRPDELPAADGREAVFLEGDVRDADQVAALVAAVVERFGRLDVVVNNAGGSPPADAATASPRFSTSIVALNLLAPLHVAQAANAVMQEQEDGGTIVNIGSVSGLRPSPGTAAYGAAKAGLLNLTESLAQEWAPKVRVNAVTGGSVLTEEFFALYYEGDAQRLAEMEAKFPSGRMTRPADIAGMCVFLASPLAAQVSGANLLVHGGGEPVETHAQR
jgi:NAD(P)-dependent dehydrogenase (short-subunit alcohol dehydrogenase family)